MFVQNRMHTKRLFAIHGHHYGRGERGSFLVFLVYLLFGPSRVSTLKNKDNLDGKCEKLCLRSRLFWLSCSQVRAVNVCDTVGIYAGT